MKFRKSTAAAIAVAAAFGLFGSAPAMATTTSGSTTGSCSDGSSGYSESLKVSWSRDNSTGKYDIQTIFLKYTRLGFEYDWVTSRTAKIINAGNTFATYSGNPGSSDTILVVEPSLVPNNLKVTVTGSGATSFSCTANIA